MKRTIVSFLCLLAMATATHAQVDIPVNHLTGRASVSIPIYSVKGAALAAPIGLIYGGGGVRVGEGGSGVGVGWSLIAGGSISRSVRGLPDDVDEGSTGRRGWLYAGLAADVGTYSPTGNDDLSICTDELTDWNKMAGYGYKKDTEPDLFYFSAPGLSGQFVFDNQASPVVRIIPYQDLSITYTRDATTQQFTSFTITNNQGIKYTFGRVESVTQMAVPYASNFASHFKTAFNRYNGNLKYNSSWNLTQILTPTGETMNFAYNTTQNISHQYTTIDNAAGTKIDTLFSTRHVVDGAELISISNALFIATFDWDGGLLNGVTVTETSYSVVKKFYLAYRWIKETNDNSIYPRTLAFLKEVSEEINCKSFPSFSFDYYGVTFGAIDGGESTFPQRNKTAQDYWGYFNNVQGTLVPSVYYNNSASDGERYRIHSKAGYTFSPAANRKVNSATIHIASLKRITYPSGGYSEVVYEPMDYFDGDSTRRGGGIRVKQVRVSDGDARTHNDMVTEYEYKDGTNSSGKILYQPALAFDDGNRMVRTANNLAADQSIMYSKVTVKQTGKGKTVYEHAIPAAYPTVSLNDFLASKSRIARAGCAGPTSLKNGYYIFPFAENTNWDFERGLPSIITTYNEAGDKLTEKTIYYQRISSGTQVIKGIVLEELPNTTYAFSPYTILAQVDKVVKTERTKTFDQVTVANFVSDSTRYTYRNVGTSPNVSVHLDSVSSVSSDGVFHRTRFRYAKDFATASPSGADAIAMNSLITANRHGTVIESIASTKRGSTTVTAAELTKYAFYGSLLMPSEKHVSTADGSFTPAYLNGSNQLVADSKYRAILYMDAYDNLGNLESAHDSRKAKQGTHFGFGKMLPVASVSNAHANETVFSDFEGVSSYSLSGGSTVSTDAWSGKWSMSLTTATTLQSGAITKGTAAYYRFTCRVKAASGGTVTAKVYNGPTETGSVSIAPVGTSWQYLETRMNMAGVSTGFVLKVTSTANVLIDDVAFYPETAEISSFTYEPMNGRTSQTDTRGITSFVEYDEMGRQKYVRNQDKDIVQMTEYQFGKPAKTLPVSTFSSSVPIGLITTTTSVVFTPDASCMSGVAYQWFIDGVASGTGSTLTTTFSTNKDHTVKLIASQVNYGSSTTEMLINPVGSATVSIALQAGQSSTILECDQNFVRNFNATVTGCIDSGSLSYFWEMRLPGQSNNWSLVGGSTTLQLNLTQAPFPSKQNYEVRLRIVANCTETVAPFSTDLIEQVSNPILITYQNNSPCQ